MPFLVPATIAFVCDGTVLVLRYTALFDGHTFVWQFLPIAAFLRLLLLGLPLLFHSYTGTAVHGVSFYRIYYVLSILILVFHMIYLAMMNPESLETIFSFHSTSILWWMLILSLASTLCHTVVLTHVTSTGGAQPPAPTMYFAVRTAHQLWEGRANEPAYLHAMNEFVMDMQARLQRARSEWTTRLEDITRTPALSALLRLFAHEHSALDQLSKVFDMDHGESLTYYIPQLVSFLLHGALYSSPVLEDWILDKCGRNVYFAHRCYWFLRAWCLEMPLAAPSQQQYCQPQHDGKYYPEERAMMERLMMRVKDQGTAVAQDVWESIRMEPAETSPAHKVEAAQLQHIPVDPATGCPSVRHFDALMNYRTRGIASFPNTTALAFDQTPRFLDALIGLAESLFLVPREERKDTLRQQLRALECDLLPSNSVYLPIGSRKQHRVWRIASEESIPISTKERVPCIVALEVLDTSVRWPIVQQHSWNESLLGTNHGADTTSQAEVEDDDGQLLWEWRFGLRHPLRRVSLLDKVTTKVKMPLDKMKTKLRDHLLSRDRADEELQSLAEEFLSDSSNQAEQGLAGPPPEIENDSKPLSRTASTGSLASLGQWSTPPAPPQLQSSRSLSTERARSNSADANRNGQSNLVYGTNTDSSNSEHLKSTGEPTEEKAPTRPPPIVFRESWATKQERVRKKSAFGEHPGWRLLPVLIKANDDLRQEQLAGQLIQRMAMILARERVNVWLCPYEILALTDSAGIIEAIPDTISLDSLKKNSPDYTSLLDFFHSHYGSGTEELAAAKANFVESLAAYAIVCFLLQIKDRHNGNILLDKFGHLVHIDFGFFFLSSPGKNVGFESAPFKLTREFVEVLEGPDSHLFRTFRNLCCKTFLALRRNCMEIIMVVEMLKDGNENLQCFRGQPSLAIQQLRERFRLDLNDRACREYVNSLIDDSIENWRTDWYDRYQRYFVGVL